MGFVFQKLKYVIFGEKPKGDWCEAGKAEKLCWNFQQTYDASPSLTQTTCGQSKYFNVIFKTIENIFLMGNLIIIK